MRFEWDERKNGTNIIKHGIDFETARLIFDDPYHVAFVERVIEGEERWHAIGSIEDIAIAVAVHTYRLEPDEEVIRIVSARLATKHERKLYGQALR